MDASPAPSSASPAISSDFASAAQLALPLSLFKQAIAHSANGLIICDAQQPHIPIVYVSPSFESLTGYSASEVIGKNCCFLQGKETEQIGIEEIRRAIAAGSGCKVLLRNYRKNGQAFWNEVTLSPLFDEAGTLTHYVGTQLDISHYLETFKALQESESRYRHLYEETPAMLHSVDSRGHIVSVSHYWLEKLGYQRNEVINQPLIHFLAKDSKRQVETMLATMEPGKARRNLHCQFVKKEGGCIDALLSTISENFSENYGATQPANAALTKASTNRFLGIVVDITERKKAQEKLRRSEALLRAINNLPPTGIFVMDCDTNQALFINSEFYRIWQLEHLQESVMRGHLNGEALLSECLSNIDLSAFVAASTAQDFTHGNKIIEDEVPLLDGRTLRRIYGPIQENNTTFAYLYVFEDITERKQAVRKLADATEAAEAANRAKSEFLANMSHELRSPLNAILGFTHILKSTSPTAEQKEHLEIIYNSGEHLLALINDILDISKIEAGRVVLTESEFDLYRLIDELRQMFHTAALEKGLRLKVERSPQMPRIIFSDRLKLRQILINLLSNAIKFTDTGNVTLQIQLKEAPRHDSNSDSNAPDLLRTLTFSVIDTGTGISPADQSRLFEAFVQTQSGLTAHEGTGLGLAISCEYVQLLGSALTVVSSLGEGATFSFDLTVAAIDAAIASIEPLEPSQARAPSQARIIGLAPGQLVYRILVVDDVDINRKLLTHLLTSVGFEVQEASNGQEAIAQWQTWQPHLIWMDMRMPVMDGETAIQHIRALEAKSEQPPNPQKLTAQNQAKKHSTKIIALTASAFEENRNTALTSGCNDFVSKPVQATDVFDTMAQHLGIRYQFETSTGLEPSPDDPEPLSPSLIAQAPNSWQYALTQATLDLDDEAILALVAQLPPQQQPLARAIEHCVKNLSYKKLLQVLQEADAVSS